MNCGYYNAVGYYNVSMFIVPYWVYNLFVIGPFLCHFPEHIQSIIYIYILYIYVIFIPIEMQLYLTSQQYTCERHILNICVFYSADFFKFTNGGMKMGRKDASATKLQVDQYRKQIGKSKTLSSC